MFSHHLVVPSGNFARDMFVLGPEEASMSSQPPLPVSEKVDVPEFFKCYQLPLILTLYGGHEIVQGSMNNPEVREYIRTCCPIGKSRSDAVKN